MWSQEDLKSDSQAVHKTVNRWLFLLHTLKPGKQFDPNSSELVTASFVHIQWPDISATYWKYLEEVS